MRETLTILGFLEGGLTGDYGLLVLESVLGVSLSFGSILGVILSAGTVLVVQGTLTLSAGVSRGS